MTIRAVYFDLGGVIVRTEFQAPRQHLAERFGMEYDGLIKLVFDSETANLASLGLTSEEEHWAAVARRLHLPESQTQSLRDEFFAGDVTDLHLLDYMRALRKQYKVGLISNAWSGLRPWIAGKKFDDVFDAMIISAEAWVAKPDSRIYRIALEALGVKDYVKFDPNIVRGLLYYTGTVFEAYELSGSLKRAILGGGRYDNLLADVGGQPLPGVGFAMGDVVIGIILQEKGLLPEFIPSPAPVLVTVFDNSLLLKSYALAAELRRSGINVMIYPEAAKLPKQFKFADKMKMKVALTIGTDEAEKGLVAVKNLLNGNQQTVRQSEAVKAVRAILESKES